MGIITEGTPWSTALLQMVGAPATPANYQFLNAWAIREHGSVSTLYANNPFFTTAGGSGSVGSIRAGQYPLIPGKSFPGGVNSAGVPQYPDISTGVDITAYHLLAQYPGIVGALKSGNPASRAGDSRFQSDLTKWSGAGYSGVQGIAAPSGPIGPTLNRPLSTAAGTNTSPSGGGAGGGFFSGPEGAISSAAGAVAGAVGSAGGAVAAPFKAAISVGEFLGKLTDPSYILRGLQIVAGAGLVGTGVVLLARQVALANDLPDPIKVAARSRGGGE